MEEGCHVGKERRLELTRLVATLPEVALQSFEVWRLDIPCNQITDVSLESGSVIAILLGKGIAIWRQLRTIPLGVQGLGQ
jgi:hypothetical protein